MTEVFDARFRVPFCCLLSGKCGSGKTQFALNLLKHMDRLLTKPFERVYWFYGQDNSLIHTLQEELPGVELEVIKGLPASFDEYTDPNINKCIVIDDLMISAASNVAVTDLFCNKSRHTNSSVLLLLQNLNYHGSERLTFLRCSHLLVLFNDPLDQSLIYSVGTKIMPRKQKTFMDIFVEVTSKPYSPLIIDGHHSTPSNARFRGCIFEDKIQHIYIPK